MTDPTAARVQTLQDAGHGWLDPQSQVALAAAPTSDQQMVAQASAFRQQLNQAPSLLDTLGHFFSDPVLQKHPSAALSLRQYLLSKQGWAPIAEGDLRTIQQNLADHGYLAAGDVNGVWTPASSQAFYQATSDHVQQQQTHSGGFSIGHALTALLPSHWVPALEGAARALPGELRTLVANVVGGADTIGSLALPTNMGNGNGYLGGALRSGAQVSKDIRGALGDQTAAHQTLDQFGNQSIFGGNEADVVNNINAILTVVPVARSGKAAIAGFDAARATAAGSAINDAAGTRFFQGLTTDLGPEAAQRGPGVIANALYNSDGGGLFRNRLFEQSPIARFTSPPIRAVFDANGKSLSHMYYAGRTLAAQPNRIAGVQALRAAAGQAQTAGISEEAINAIQKKLGAHGTALDNQIHAAGTIGGPFGMALDLASGTFNGPIHTAATLRAAQEGRQVLIGVNPSHTVGEIIGHASQLIEGAMKPLNEGWAIHAGTGMSGEATTVEKMAAEFGALETQLYWNDKFNRFAAVHHAQATIDESLVPGSPAHLAAFEAATHEALSDPALLGPARDALMGNLDELAWRIGQEGNRIRRDAQDPHRQGMAAYAALLQPVTELLRNHPNELFSPADLHALSAAQDTHKFNELMGDAASPAPTATSDFRAGLPGSPAGSFGVARRALPGQEPEVETQTERLMLDKAGQLQRELDAAGTADVAAEDVGTAVPYDAAKEAAVKRDAINYLITYRGLNEKEMEGFDAAHLIQVIRETAARAPKDVMLALDASPRAKEIVKQIEDAGYKLVAGTDIGHVFSPPIIDPVMIEGYHSAWRKVANVMGMNNIPVSSEDSGMIRRVVTERTLQESINKGLIRVPPSYNGARLNTYILNNLESRAELSRGERIAYGVGDLFGTHNRLARQVLGPDATAEDIAAWKLKEQTQIAKGTQPIEVRPKEIVNALTRDSSQVIKDALGITGRHPFMDEHSAQNTADAFIHALVHEPAWAFGAGKLEDLYRAGFGFLGTRASGSNSLVRHLARLPNATIRARNRYRFQLDPMFSMKRVAKSALKASIPGDHGVSAPLTVRPLGYMAKHGYVGEAFQTLNRVMPMKSAEGFDTNDRLLWEQDAFGIYNPRHHMALRAHELDKAGLSDKEILKDLTRTFTYGDRTAFERTLGTIWYPFSFEKALWRNVGSYMLDRPGSRLAAMAAYDAYAALSQHDHIDQWLKDHAPILSEFKKMNAFEHGIGPGQVGGINALYAPLLWNVFGPQKYGGEKAPTVDAIQNIFPVLRELNSLLVGYSPTTGVAHGGTLTAQAGIGLWGLQQALDKGTQFAHMGKPLDAVFNKIGSVVPLRSETYTAEQNRAWAYRNSLILALAPVLDYNYHNRSAEKVWGPDAPAAVRGKPVNRSSIDEIVHGRYKSYDPSVAQSLAVIKKTEMERYLTDIAATDPGRAAAYQQFTVPAEKLRPILQRAVTNPDQYGQLAKAESVFREYAINLAEQDPGFLALYNRFYLSEFGPIEAVAF